MGQLKESSLTINIKAEKVIHIERYLDFKIVCKSTGVKPINLQRIITTQQAYECLLSKYDLDQIMVKEFFYIMALNRNSRLLGIMKCQKEAFMGRLLI
ncbi:MAG: hypothetical protein JWN78_781 [Bacteroidota bacterium]|nr:hypothetical protein [Bacteroidota bacterium]